MTGFSASAASVLADALKDRIQGEVRFDNGSRALYATDSSNYRQVPIGVVVPRSVEDVIETVAICREHGAPVLARGAGTSLAGQCCNIAVVIDMSKYLNRILAIDPGRRIAAVEPGCVLDWLRDAAETHHLTFGPDPSTHDHNCLGGMIGNNSCGVHSVMAGRTADNVESLEILTYDGLRLQVGKTGDEELQAIIAAGGRRGEIYGRLLALRDRYADLIRARYPKIPRRVSGFNLDQLLPENGFHVGRALVGSEGTCVTVLAAHLNLVPSPPCRCVVVFGFDDVFLAGDHVTELLRFGPIGLEGMDDRLVAAMRKKGMHREQLALLPKGGGWLIAEFGGDRPEQAEMQARAAMEGLGISSARPDMRLITDPLHQGQIWEIRRSGLGATAHVPGEPPTWEGWEDAAVPPDKVGSYLRDFRALLDEFGYRCALYGHFGDGCIHVRIDFDLMSRPGIGKYRAFIGRAADLVLRYGGSLSGEHGDGQSRAEFLPRMFGPELIGAFREFKAIWDPDNRMNPGKVVDPYPIDSNLRLGADFHPPEPATVFSYPADDGSFVHAALRCVGVGKCRHASGGVMCPSYMVTREEKHSTRGRAHMLFEMVHGSQGDGGPITEGWRSEAVRDALDLCLACKGCKRDCPVGVDMATYKAEFFSHYYRGRLRPRSAYSMGLIYWWSRLAEPFPALANALTQTPYLGDAVKWLGGIAPRRRMPSFQTSFRSRFRRTDPDRGRRVILFPDTFNNHFHPATAMAARAVLETAGFHVDLPRTSLCCARPLFAWGMLDLARRQLRRVLDVLEPDIRAATPIIGLEPACIASFRDELPDLLPHDERARRLSRQAVMLGDFLADQEWRPPRIGRPALLHFHCHHHAVIGKSGEETMLKRLGIDYRLLDSGCCGMAGSFGFEADHYDISVRAGERSLLPAVRAAAPDTLILADGFSCREQISQGSGRRALHLAELLAQAISGAPAGEQERMMQRESGS